MTTLRNFAAVYALYRSGGHSVRYSVRVAYEIAVLGASF